MRMNAMGNVDASFTADYPVAATFNNAGEIIYTAHNYSDAPIAVTFSDGYILDVPARKMATSKDLSIIGILSSNFQQAFANGSVELNLMVSGGTPTKVDFYDGYEFLGEVTEWPFSYIATNLNAGKHGFYARIYQATDYTITNITSVNGGRQLPYIAPAIAIPGIIQAGFYDKFEGGNGQGISYSDASVN